VGGRLINFHHPTPVLVAIILATSVLSSAAQVVRVGAFGKPFPIAERNSHSFSWAVSHLGFFFTQFYRIGVWTKYRSDRTFTKSPDHCIVGA